MVVDNIYSKEAAVAMVEKLFVETPAQLENAKFVAEKCVDEVTKASGSRCELAFTLVECAKKHEEF